MIKTISDLGSWCGITQRAYLENRDNVHCTFSALRKLLVTCIFMRSDRPVTQALTKSDVSDTKSINIMVDFRCKKGDKGGLWKN